MDIVVNAKINPNRDLFFGRIFFGVENVILEKILEEGVIA